ncbi:MAG: hypothetical protein AAGG48_23325 [Planctomycetota bacterium]
MIYYLAFLLFSAIAAVAISERDAATRPRDPWIISEIDIIYKERGYVPIDAEPHLPIYLVHCVRDNVLVHLVCSDYLPSGLSVGAEVYIESGLRRSRRAARGWPLDQVAYSLKPNGQDEYEQNQVMQRSGIGLSPRFARYNQITAR